MAEQELDVRGLRKPDRHPVIFAAYDDLAVDASFVLVNNHDPVHLREEFDAEHAGSYGWDYLAEGPEWRIRISKLASTPLPRVLCDTTSLDTGIESDATGAVWKLQMRNRDLDSNIIHLAAGTCKVVDQQGECHEVERVAPLRHRPRRPQPPVGRLSEHLAQIVAGHVVLGAQRRTP